MIALRYFQQLKKLERLQLLFGIMSRIGIVVFAIYAFGCTAEKEKDTSLVQREASTLTTAKVFITAKDTDKRLTLNGSVSFESRTQPLENDHLQLTS